MGEVRGEVVLDVVGSRSGGGGTSAAATVEVTRRTNITIRSLRAATA